MSFGFETMDRHVEDVEELEGTDLQVAAEHYAYKAKVGEFYFVLTLPPTAFPGAGTRERIVCGHGSKRAYSTLAYRTHGWTNCR